MESTQLLCPNGHKNQLFIYFRPFNKIITDESLQIIFNNITKMKKILCCFECKKTINEKNECSNNNSNNSISKRKFIFPTDALYIDYMAKLLEYYYSKCNHDFTNHEPAEIINTSTRRTKCNKCLLYFIWNTEHLKGVCFGHQDYTSYLCNQDPIYEPANYYTNIYLTDTNTNIKSNYNTNINNEHNINLKIKKQIVDVPTEFYVRCSYCEDHRVKSYETLKKKYEEQLSFNHKSAVMILTCLHYFRPIIKQMYINDADTLISCNYALTRGVFENSFINHEIYECINCGLRLIIFHMQDEKLILCKYCRKKDDNCDCNNPVFIEHNLYCTNCRKMSYTCKCTLPHFRISISKKSE